MDSQIQCSICLEIFHAICSITKCDSDLWSSWFCEACASVFPFNMIDNDEMLSIYNCNTKDDLDDNNSLLFNPFDLDKGANVDDCHNIDIDPDLNLFSDLKNSLSCKYFTEGQANDLFESLSNRGNIFSVLHFNIRSLVKNMDHLVTFMSTLKLTFSIIGLSETWLTDNLKESGIYELPGYKSVHAIRPHRTGGGVSIFVQQHFQFSRRDDLVLSYDECNVESVLIEIVTAKNKNIIIGNIYKPPDTDTVKFNNSINNVLTRINKEDKICYILGDFNINLLKYETHSFTKEFLNILQANYFFPAIVKPTRITAKSATLIDNILFNSLKFERNSGLIFTDITDHLPIFQIVTLDNGLNRTNVAPQTVRKFSESNKLQFKNMLQEVSFDEVFREKDPNLAYSIFMKLFNRCFIKCFPLTYCRNNRKENNQPWFTRGLK